MTFFMSDLFTGPSREELNRQIRSLQGALNTSFETNQKLHQRVLKAEHKVIEHQKEDKVMSSTATYNDYAMSRVEKFRVIQSRPNSEYDYFVLKSGRKTYDEALALAQSLAVQYPQNTYYVSGVLATVKAEIPVASVQHFAPVKEKVDTSTQG